MMNLRVLEHYCLTIIIMPVSLFIFTHTCTITHPSLLDDLLFDGYLYSLGTYVCVGTTIQKRVATASIGTYIRGVLVNDGYLCSRVYGIIGSARARTPEPLPLWITPIRHAR